MTRDTPRKRRGLERCPDCRRIVLRQSDHDCPDTES